MKKHARLCDRGIAAALGALTLVLYTATLSSGAYFGRPASLTAQTLNLVPEYVANQPLWKMVAGALTALPGDPVFLLNLFSALCGALCVALMYGLIRHAVGQAIDTAIIDEKRAVTAARLGGVAAATALAGSVPFWIVATRAHTAAFHLLLILGAAALLLPYAATTRARYAVLFALLYGAGLVEYEAFWPLAPLAGGFLLFFGWRARQLRVSFVLLLAAVALLACSALYGLAIWRFSRLDDYELRAFTGWGAALWDFWRMQYREMTRALPAVGGLLVALFAILPWLGALLTGRRALNEERDWGYYILHAVMSVIAIAMLFNPPFSPWGLRPNPSQPLVMPYALIAATLGYLTAYVWLLPFGWWPDDREVRRPLLRGLLCGLLILPFFGAAGYAALANFPLANGRSGAALNRYTREIVAATPARCEWLWTDGTLDDLIEIEIWRAGRSLQTLNLRGDAHTLYVRHVARRMDTPRLRNLVNIGLVPLAQGWIGSDPAAAEKVAVMTWPDLWFGAGHVPLPNRLLFVGGQTAQDLPADAWEQHRAFWTRMDDILADMDRAPAFLRRFFVGYMRAHASLVANNLGVTLEDAARSPEDAFGAYAAARKLNPYNVSALLNQWTMMQADFAPEPAQATEIEGTMKRLREAMEGREREIWGLARHHGYVRSPESFYDAGLRWAMSGRPGLALAGMRRALDLSAEEQKPAIRQTLADLYLQTHSEQAGEDIYRALLKENPANVRALLGMARLAARGGNRQAAAEYLDRARDAGADKAVLALEWAAAYLAVGAQDEARVVLEEILELDRNLMRAWVMLAEIFARQNKPRELERCLGPIAGHRETAHLAPILRGEAALARGDFEEARQYFEMALSINRQSRPLLNRLLVLAFQRQNRDEALRYARDMLRLEPRHGLANFIMGQVQHEQGQLDRAEDFYRRSLEQRPLAPALNNLAMILLEKELYEEAEQRIQQALAAPDAKLYETSLQDTYGVILMRTGRLTQAREALDRAAGRNLPVALLHLAELAWLENRPAEARRLLRDAQARRAELSETEQTQLDTLQRKTENAQP